jgi:2-C-methyl-D-erythritol 4-phosphate cytidylyltransferase
VAAGRGARLGGETPKAFVTLAGQPLIFYALEAAARSAAIGAIVVVTDPDLAYHSMPNLSAEARDKVFQITAGGATRRHSVIRGLDGIRDEVQLDPVVLVHDAARPFTPPELFDRAAREAVHGAVICCQPVVDTVKKIDGDRIVATLQRETLALAQTPQCARLSLLRQAHARAGEAAAGDDAVLLEALGVPVRVITGPSTNFKITTPEDLELAEAWVRAGGAPWMPTAREE